MLGQVVLAPYSGAGVVLTYSSYSAQIPLLKDKKGDPFPLIKKPEYSKLVFKRAEE